ncbi:unnamed protein product [Polarella glacialis]|uniref:Uncharacterized protein n=1 Tax=Polarella glacialis TaxID=89957 RepID=A0A813LMD3_POLGL|nr:unnamed protein product [Polarella glacialis]
MGDEEVWSVPGELIRPWPLADPDLIVIEAGSTVLPLGLAEASPTVEAGTEDESGPGAGSTLRGSGEVEGNAVEAEEAEEGGPPASPVQDFVPLLWDCNKAQVLAHLAAAGYTDDMLCVEAGEALSLVTQVLNELSLAVEDDQLKHLVDGVSRHIASLQVVQPLRKRARGSGYLAVLGDAATLCLVGDCLVATRQSYVPPGTRLRAGLRRCRLMKLADTTEERQLVADEERGRWIAVVLIDCPGRTLALQSADPTRVIGMSIGKTRTSTMRGYLKAWDKFSRWLRLWADELWPSTAARLLDYFLIFLDEPCAMSAPQIFWQAFAWLEKAAGYNVDARLSAESSVKQAPDFANTALSCKAPPRKQAPRLPACVRASMEVMVVTTTYVMALRFFAWCLLIMNWGSLRFDDIQHLLPGRLRMLGDLMVAELTQTKTTGAGKRVREVPLAIWKGCSLTGTPWLEAGLVMLELVGKLERDFLLPRAHHEGQYFLNQVAKYTDAASLLRATLCQLKTLKLTIAGGWVETSDKLLPEVLCAGFWTLHSGRAGLPSECAMLGFAKSERDLLGRWCPGVSADYTRTYRQCVAAMQRRVVEAQCCDGAANLSEEYDITDAMATYLGKAVGPQEAETILAAWTASTRSYAQQMIAAHSVEPHGAAGTPAVDRPATPRHPAMQVPADGGPGMDSSYVIIYTRGRRSARLHRTTGGCYWAGIEVRDSEAYKGLPAAGLYDSRCKFCFPEDKVTGAAPSSESGSETDSSDSDAQ